MTEIQQLADGVSATIREWCERRFEAFAKTFRQPVDGRDGANGRDGIDGIDGKSADESAIEARLLDRIVRKLDEIPAPKNGADGAAGKDGKDGADGSNGKDGNDGQKGEDGAAGRDGQDGRNGEPGAAGRDGIDGKDGAPGRDFDPEQLAAAVQIEIGKQFADVYERLIRAMPVPKDGKSITLDDVTPLLEGEVSKWELDFERRANEMLQRTLDRMREPRDGKDGINLADFDLEARDGGRTIALRLHAADGSMITREVRLAVPLDRGSYVRGKDYQAGDGVTYGGSIWIAQCDTDASPGDSKDGTPWRLAVKRGKDGAQ